MIKYYPLFLNLEKMKCAVIGGGKIAERKIKTLLYYKAKKIIIISPEITKGIEKLNKEKKIVLKLKKFKSGDIKNIGLLIIATENHNLNNEIAKKANKITTLINVVDAGEKGNFIVPSSFEQGGLQIAVSSSGLCPALAKKIKGNLAEKYNPNYKTYLNFISKIRKKLLKEVKNKKKYKNIMQELTSLETLNLVENSSAKLWKEHIKKGLNKCYRITHF